MERLPRDVLLTIVYKLAAQDPLSLPRAAYSCKAVLRVTDENPDVWRAAFLADSFGKIGKEVAEADVRLVGELENTIEELGGFRQLTVARCFKRITAHSLEQTQARKLGPHSFAQPGPSSPVREGGPRFLALVRVRGTLLLWGRCTEVLRRWDPSRRCILSEDPGPDGVRRFKGYLGLRPALPRKQFQRLRSFTKLPSQGSADLACEIFEWEAQGETRGPVARVWDGPQVDVSNTMFAHHVRLRGQLELSFQTAKAEYKGPKIATVMLPARTEDDKEVPWTERFTADEAL